MNRLIEKPFSEACVRNREPILAVLRESFADRLRVLEIGSGTGQHAVHFAAALPQLVWQTSDRPEYLPGIRAWLDEAQLPNTPPPLTLDVAAGPWPAPTFDAVFTANSLHIMSWDEVQALFAALPAILAADAVLVVYGPFNRNGRFTAPSNAEFDAALKARDPKMGLRDLEAVDRLAGDIGLMLVDDRALPANNHCIVWRRVVPIPA
jgi:SAM-dependent methyltransferase